MQLIARLLQMTDLRQTSFLGSLADFAGVSLQHAPILLTMLFVLSPGVPLDHT